MQLKNNKTGNVQFHYTTDKGEVEYIHIPAGATVEIDDKVFAQLCKPLSPATEMELVVTGIEGDVPVQMDKKDVAIKEYFPTGKIKQVNLIKLQIEAGDLVVVERPAVSKEEVAKVLTANGIDFSKMDADQIMALYDKLA